VAHRYARFDPAYRTGKQFEVKKSNKGSCEINQINDPEVPYSWLGIEPYFLYLHIIKNLQFRGQ